MTNDLDTLRFVEREMKQLHDAGVVTDDKYEAVQAKLNRMMAVERLDAELRLHRAMLKLNDPTWVNEAEGCNCLKCEQQYFRNLYQ